MTQMLTQICADEQGTRFLSGFRQAQHDRKLSVDG
jgi:hypothetical protein